jgi:hypothetical protein
MAGKIMTRFKPSYPHALCADAPSLGDDDEVDEEEDESGAKYAAKIIPAVAISSMQGTIDRLADFFERSMAVTGMTPPNTTGPREATVTTHLAKAMHLLQTGEDDLSQSEKAKLINRFVAKPATAEAYILVTDPVLRRLWLRSQLSGEAVAAM